MNLWPQKYKTPKPQNPKTPYEILTNKIKFKTIDLEGHF